MAATKSVTRVERMAVMRKASNVFGGVGVKINGRESGFHCWLPFVFLLFFGLRQPSPLLWGVLFPSLSWRSSLQRLYNASPRAEPFDNSVLHGLFSRLLSTCFCPHSRTVQLPCHDFSSCQLIILH